MFARRLRIPAARGPLFEYLLMQRARVLKISTLKASEKEKHIILKNLPQAAARYLASPNWQLQRGHPDNPNEK